MEEEWDEEPGWLEVRGYRIRRFITRPRAALNSRRPAVLFLAGLGPRSVAASLASAHPRDGWAYLMRSLAAAGFVTVRVEHSGVGESGGPSYVESDLGSELDGYRAALDEVARAPFVDPSRIFLFGHSLGGVLAPLLAASGSPALAGVAVYGAPSRPWSEHMAESARRQLTLAGESAGLIEIEAERAARFYSLLLRGDFDAERLAREGLEIAGCIAAADLRGSTLHGRSLAYFREIERIDIEEAWRAVRSPVLALQGEHDWVVADDDHERIAALCEAAGDAAACWLPGIDHDLQRHASLAASYAARGRGEADSSAPEAAIAWMKRRPPRDPAFTADHRAGHTGDPSEEPS